MPELPDVEHFRCIFAGHAAGRTVRSVWADPTILRNTTPRTLGRALAGRTFEQPERIGKWLICWTDGPALLLHFGMTGHLIWSHGQEAPHRWDRVTLLLDDGGELRYRNMRKLGGAWLAHDRLQAAQVMGPLGPDALTLERADFLRRLERRRGGVKAALMDQRFVAGIGNIFADETLWQARLHPRRDISSLSDRERAGLHRCIRRVLRMAVDDYSAIPRRAWLSAVRGRAEAACPRCSAPLQRTTVAGRTTYFCPLCQPAQPGTGGPGRMGAR